MISYLESAFKKYSVYLIVILFVVASVWLIGKAVYSTEETIDASKDADAFFNAKIETTD